MKQIYLYCTPDGSVSLTDIAHVSRQAPFSLWMGLFGALVHPWRSRRGHPGRLDWAPSLLLYAALAVLLGLRLTAPARGSVLLADGAAVLLGVTAIVWSAALIRRRRSERMAREHHPGGKRHGHGHSHHGGHHGEQHGYGSYGGGHPHQHEKKHGKHHHGHGYEINGVPADPVTAPAAPPETVAPVAQQSQSEPSNPQPVAEEPRQDVCVGDCRLCELEICAKSGRPNPRRRR